MRIISAICDNKSQNKSKFLKSCKRFSFYLEASVKPLIPSSENFYGHNKVTMTLQYKECH